MITLLPLAGDHGAEQPSVLVAPLYEVFFAAILLLIMWIIIGKTALPKLFKTIDEREEKIKDGLQAADKAHADLAAAERRRDELIREANADAQAIRERANDEAKKIVSAARTEAQAEAARIAEAAQRQIEAERLAAQETLRQDIGSLATDLAEKIVGEHLTDTALTDRVIDRFLNDLENELAATPVGGTN